MQSWRQTFEKVGRKLLFGAALALVLLALSGFLSFRNARHLIATTTRVNAVHESISNQKELLARLNQAESGLFGYFVTEDENFLHPYETATNAIPSIVDAVRQDLVDHQDVQQELNSLHILIQQRLAQMEDRLRVFKAKGRNAAVELVKRGEAKSVMDQIRASIGVLIQHEVERLGRMHNDSVASARTTLIVDILFGSVSVAALAAILAWLFRENVTRRETEEKLRKAGHELEMRVAERTADLATANASLQVEIDEHRRAEEAVRASEQKLAEAAQALADKNQDLEMLIYVASHDLRAPLLNVRGFVSELMRSCTELQNVIERSSDSMLPKAQVAAALEDMPESARFIQTAVAKMDSLLSGFLRLSRLGRSALRISRVDMNAMVGSICESLAFQFRECGGQIHVDRLPKCLGDATQLTQVFSNLIDNTVKYRDPARPLRVNITGSIENGMVAYHVTDNGTGIPPEHLDRVFEIFHRVNPRDGEGEGLGLTIARRVLDRLNGRLRVQSHFGVGSTFTVYLPPTEREQERHEKIRECNNV